MLRSTEVESNLFQEFNQLSLPSYRSSVYRQGGTRCRMVANHSGRMRMVRRYHRVESDGQNCDWIRMPMVHCPSRSRMPLPMVRYRTLELCIYGQFTAIFLGAFPQIIACTTCRVSILVAPLSQSF
jgi:hypothetical protein